MANLNIKVRPRSSGPTAPILDSTARRESTVHALYERLESYRFVLVRGTPASGKSTLAALLEAHMRNMQPTLDSIIIGAWQKADELSWSTRLLKAGNYKDPNTVIIIDDAQLTYWDIGFWNQFIKPIIGAPVPSTFRVILFAGYSSPKGRATVEPDGDTTWIPNHCRIGLRPVVLNEDPITPVGLLLTFEEFADMVKRICPEELFEQDFLDYMFCATAGHAGAVADLLRIIIAHDSYRSIKREDKKYSLERFRSNISIERLWSGLENGSIFRRGLPATRELRDPCIARVFRAVLSYNSVTDQMMVSTQDKEALQRCFKNGWLHATTTMQAHIVYIFTTPLHQWFVEYYLGTNVLSPTITEQDLLVFAIHVIQHFPRGQLSSERAIGASSKQRPPEAQFQDEFYRCCLMHSDGSLITFPEFGDANGRIDFYVPFKKWGVELLRDGDGVANHSSRFTNPGAYSKMEFEDYVILDFRTTRPSLPHPGIPKLFHVVLENNCGSVKIVRGSSLELVEEFELLN